METCVLVQHCYAECKTASIWCANYDCILQWEKCRKSNVAFGMEIGSLCAELLQQKAHCWMRLELAEFLNSVLNELSDQAEV